MKALLVLAPLALFAGLFILLKFREAPLYTVSVDQLPSVIAKLYGLAAGKHGTWVMFFFTPPGTSSQQEEVNLQYSVENGVVGLDWVLLGERNIADGDKVGSFIREKGFVLLTAQENKVRYLRVEGNGIQQLGVSIVTELYGLASSAPLRFYTEGFAWSDNSVERV